VTQATQASPANKANGGTRTDDDMETTR
jgi:hypothetical protein